MFSNKGRYVFCVLACVGNMICLLGRESMRIAIIPIQEETNMTAQMKGHVLSTKFEIISSELK